jgi:MFS family permease
MTSSDAARSTESTRRWVLAVTSAASLMVVLDALVVSTALSSIRTDLGATIEQLEWTVNAYVLSFAVLLMTAAALGDRFGRRRVFVSGLGLFVAASAACALAPGVGWLIAARLLQGAGAALLMPLALALLSAAFPPGLRPRALGAFAAVTGLAVPLGPLFGGAVVEGISWPWIFWLNVPIGLVLIPLALTRIEESLGPDTAIDVPGLALFTGAAVGIVWGLVRGNAARWDSPEVLLASTLGVLLLVAFVSWELHAREPMTICSSARQECCFRRNQRSSAEPVDAQLAFRPGRGLQSSTRDVDGSGSSRPRGSHERSPRFRPQRRRVPRPGCRSRAGAADLDRASGPPTRPRRDGP